MIDYGYWFYHELADKIGLPGKPYDKQGDSYIVLETPRGTFDVKISSLRMELFRKNPKCVSCHRKGTLWILQAHRPNEAPHLNLFAIGEEVEEWKKLSLNGLIMMTKDHIIPRSFGGPTDLHNLQTMCSICNGIKGNGQKQIGHIGRKIIYAPMSPPEIMCLNGKAHFT
jgi:hypothetical protein